MHGRARKPRGRGENLRQPRASLRHRRLPPLRLLRGWEGRGCRRPVQRLRDRGAALVPETGARARALPLRRGAARGGGAPGALGRGERAAGENPAPLPGFAGAHPGGHPQRQLRSRQLQPALQGGGAGDRKRTGARAQGAARGALHPDGRLYLCGADFEGGRQALPVPAARAAAGGLRRHAGGGDRAQADAPGAKAGRHPALAGAHRGAARWTAIFKGRGPAARPGRGRAGFPPSCGKFTDGKGR